MTAARTKMSKSGILCGVRIMQIIGLLLLYYTYITGTLGMKDFFAHDHLFSVLSLDKCHQASL